VSSEKHGNDANANQTSNDQRYGQDSRFLESGCAILRQSDVAFFGNELELEELENLVGEIDSYGGRLVPVINTIFKGENNILVLERAPDSSLCQYFSSHLGLSLPRIEALSHQDYLANAKSAFSWAKERISHDTYWLDGYVTDNALSTWSTNLRKPTISSVQGSHRGNNKRLLHEFLMGSDLPLPITRIASDASQARKQLLKLKGMGFHKAAVRSAVGASGIGTIKADLSNVEAIPPTPDFFFREGPCLVQGWIEVGNNNVIDVKSPSVQLFLDDSSVHLYDITDQILSKDSVHEGNVSPPPYLDESLKDEGIVPINFNFDRSGKVAKLQMLFLANDVDRCLNLVRELEGDTRLRLQAERD